MSPVSTFDGAALKALLRASRVDKEWQRELAELRLESFGESRVRTATFEDD